VVHLELARKVIESQPEAAEIAGPEAVGEGDKLKRGIEI